MAHFDPRNLPDEIFVRFDELDAQLLASKTPGELIADGCSGHLNVGVYKLVRKVTIEKTISVKDADPSS